MANLEFPQSKRLKLKRHFDYLIENKKKISSQNFLIYYTECLEPERKIAFSVSKKISKFAYVRNKIRRQLKEVFRVNQHYINKRYDMLIIAKQTVINASFKDKENDLKELLDRIGLWID